MFVNNYEPGCYLICVQRSNIVVLCIEMYILIYIVIKLWTIVYSYNLIIIYSI